MIDLRLLGAVEVRADGAPTLLTQPKRLALLLYLALAEPAGLHSRDRLLTLLWPEADEASARHSLRNALHSLRQSLGAEVILTRGEDYVGLDFARVRCDALELRHHISAGRVTEAIALWGGDLAPGFHVSGAPDMEQWLDEQRIGLHSSLRAAAWTQARELEGAGQDGLDAVRRAVRLDPGDEPGTRWLMLLLDAAGDRSGALRAYERLADWLARELETEPSDETKALAASLRGPVPPVRRRERATLLDADGTGATEVHPPRRNAWKRGMRAARPLAIVLGSSLLLRWSAGTSDPSPVSEGSSVVDGERAVLRLPARYRANTAAYSSYLRGLTLRFEFRFTESRDTFAALVDREPLYVPGLCGLAHALIFTALNNLTEPGEAWPKVHELATRALALDSTAGSAWLALASEDMFDKLDLPEAGERIDRAGRLDPEDPDMPAMRSVWFRFFADMDSSIAQARLAHRVDPLSILYARLVGEQLYFGRRFEEARQVYAGLLRDDPAWRRGYRDLADIYVALGQPREAVKWRRRARVAEGDVLGAAALTASSDSGAVRVLAADTRRALAQYASAARAGEPVPPYLYASAFAALGDTISTFRWLDSMLVHNDSYRHQIRVDPVFDFLRQDPRYRSWESRSRLPPRQVVRRER